MLILKIVLGLLGLGVVVFVHELGHFLAARWMGIGVEAFSIGWGKPILKKKIGAVEYRLGLFPLGGYCKMKGENEFQEAYEKNQGGGRTEEGSYFAAHPLRRVITCVAGPLFNLAFAVLVLSIIWGIGFEVTTLDNRIVLVSDISPGNVNPADEAGLKTGDRIIEIKGVKTETYHDIQESIAVRPGEELPLRVERNGEILSLRVKPVLEKSTGAGKIGVYFWTDPVIEKIAAGSPAEIAGLESGDRILKVNGADLPHTMRLVNILDEKPPALNLEYRRGDEILTANLIPVYKEAEGRDLGIIWKAVKYRTPRLSPPLALVKGAEETWKTFTVSVKSLSLLFKGIDLTQAVSGPVRITYMVGDAAAEGFNQGFGAGLSSMASFLSLISIALCIMNLLPLPILDGGMILLFFIEAIRRKPLHPRFVYAFQTVGVVLIFGLMIFAVFGDILYLAKR
jgi:regulator of sigma E protease